MSKIRLPLHNNGIYHFMNNILWQVGTFYSKWISIFKYSKCLKINCIINNKTIHILSIVYLYVYFDSDQRDVYCIDFIMMYYFIKLKLFNC